MSEKGYRSEPAHSPYHDLLPIGEQVSGDPLVDDPMSCFEAVTLKRLEPMLVPEEPRAGELDRSECGHCRPGDYLLWRDEHWHLKAGFAPIGIPFIGGLATNEHYRLEDTPTEILLALGPLLQRLSGAVKEIPGVARAHFSRWGDGSEHFHLWVLARPAGMMQGRGPMLAFWDDVLPKLPDALVTEHHRIVAEAMARGGGETA